MEGKTLAGAVGLAAVAVMGIGMAALYGAGPPPAPERPRPPPPPEALMNSELRYSPTVYRGLLEQDARGFGVQPPTLDDLRKPFPYFEEVKARRPLRPRTPLDTAHLRLSMDVEKQRATIEGQTFAFEHLVLRIENRTNKYLAYRVVSDVPDRKKCMSKGDIPHSALVLEPRQVIRRTECLYRQHESVDVVSAEVMELPALSAYYVARMPATSTLYDQRTASGHIPLKGTLCPQTFSWREIQEGTNSRELGWRDIVDYYARHSCEEFAFFRSYRYRKDPGAPLPARPLD